MITHVRYIMRLSISIILMLICCHPSYAENNTVNSAAVPNNDVLKKNPVDILADDLTYDALSKTIVATGNVTLIQKLPHGQRQLFCSRLIYNSTQKTVQAFGSANKEIEFHDSNGEIIKAKSLDLTDDFKTGVIEAMTLITKDSATLHSCRGTRENGVMSRLEDADYTACKLCKNADPLWQLKAKSVMHDINEHKIEYEDAHLEFKGVPIFYTPYFSHPDPTVKRKSGILTPTYGHNSDLGYLVGMPVYYVISDQKDVTLVPTMTTKQSGIIQGEFRNRFEDGAFLVQGSFTRSKTIPNVAAIQTSPQEQPKVPSQDRWNVVVKSNVDINAQQRFLMDLNRASDTTYLSRYSLAVQDTPFLRSNTNLRSSMAWQYFGDDRYADLQSYAFQTDAQATTPLVLPKGTFHYQSKMPELGGVWSYEGNVLAMLRRQPVVGTSGTQMYRVSNGLSWKRPWLLSAGQLVTLDLQTRVDMYMMHKYFENSTTASTRPLAHKHVRLFPQGSLDWQWPFANQLQTCDWVVSPRAMIVSSPLNINNRHIPNEDSRTFELDDITLFAPNRFFGIDRVDAGSRVVVGLENELRFREQRSVALFIGQSRRLDHQHVVNTGEGEDQRSSDLIGRLRVTPASWLSSRYRLGYNPSTKAIRFSEFGLVVGKPIFKLNTGYVYLNKNATLSGYALSQVNVHVSSQITETWKASIGQIRNLKRNGGGASLASFLAASYEDECFAVELGVYRSAQYDRDIKPETAFLVRINFKTLSDISISAAPVYQESPLSSGL